MVSLVGCIVPRTFVYARAIRAQPPPRAAQPDPAARPRVVPTDADVDEVLDRARAVLRRARATGCAPDDGDDAVSAERGYLREVGNLVFHLSVLVVLVGFALGGLFGYQGGVIVVGGDTASPTPPPSTTTSTPAACSAPTTSTRSRSPSTTSTSSG